jgi:hypothetical protein
VQRIKGATQRDLAAGEELELKRGSSNGNNTYGFTATELRALRSLKTPYKIQHFLNTIPYHHGNTAWSPRLVLQHKTAHCLEGAIFAAAALRVNGFEPLLLDLEAVQDVDHVLAIFKVAGHWGAIGKSNYAGLRYREPVYRSLRELAMSYFDDYFNLRGERTLRGFSRPLNLRRFDPMNWMTTDEPLWDIPEALVTTPHVAVITSKQAKALNRLDSRKFDSGLVGHLKH